MLEKHGLLFLTNLPWVIQGQTAQFILKILKFKQVLLPVFGLVLKTQSWLTRHCVGISPAILPKYCRIMSIFHSSEKCLFSLHYLPGTADSIMSETSFPGLTEVTDTVPLFNYCFFFFFFFNFKWEDIKQHFWKQKIKLSHTLPSPNTMFFLICFPPIFVFMHTYFINL